MKKIRNYALAGAALIGAGTSSAFASGVTIPDIGCDTGAYITAGITSVGAVAAVAVGGYFAFLVVRRALKWGNKIG